MAGEVHLRRTERNPGPGKRLIVVQVELRGVVRHIRTYATSKKEALMMAFDMVVEEHDLSKDPVHVFID